MRRRVYLVTNGTDWDIFGTLKRAQAHIASQGNYEYENSKNPHVWFYNNPNDLDDQLTIYRTLVR